jgi:hypothetical protein
MHGPHRNLQKSRLSVTLHRSDIPPLKSAGRSLLLSVVCCTAQTRQLGTVSSLEQVDVRRCDDSR